MSTNHGVIQGYNGIAVVAEAELVVAGVFTDVLLYASELNLIGRDTFAIDGCKLPSNAAQGGPKDRGPPSGTRVAQYQKKLATWTSPTLARRRRCG